MSAANKLYISDGGAPSGAAGLVLKLDEHIYTGRKQFREIFGAVTSLESDLLVLASCVFAVDRGVPRQEREDFTRRFEISVPVVNIGRLQPLVPTIESALRSLSNDSWRLSLRQQPGEPEEEVTFHRSGGATLLFSGGIDSLSAAAEFGESMGLHLVSHVTRNQDTRTTQAKLVRTLRSSGINLPHYQFFVSAKDTPGFDHDIEGTQRTRSFMFMILAALVARRNGHEQILMIAENGQLAIHLTLNQARVGAFSTHTAHPDVLSAMQLFLRDALRMPFRIENPYVYRTKSEVVAGLWNRLRKAIFESTSCWRNARLPAGKNHCGECIPCYVRRVAIEVHGRDKTAYARDIFSEDIGSLSPNDDGRRNLIDLCEFSRRFVDQPEIELMADWPELYSPNLDANEAVKMYKRAAQETLTVLGRYPGVSPLLQ